MALKAAYKSAPIFSSHPGLLSNAVALVMMGLAESTRLKQGTALRSYFSFLQAHSQPISFPPDVPLLLAFITFLSICKQLASKTIQGYVDALHSVCTDLNLNPSPFFSPLIKRALRAAQRLKPHSISTAKYRLPLTIWVLFVLHGYLSPKIFLDTIIFAAALTSFYGPTRGSVVSVKRSKSGNIFIQRRFVQWFPDKVGVGHAFAQLSS